MAYNNLAYDLSKYEHTKPDKSPRIKVHKSKGDYRFRSKIIVITMTAGVLLRRCYLWESSNGSTLKLQKATGC